jgi:hypothetical protein
MVGKVIEVPGELVASQVKFNREAGRAFVAELPRRVEQFLERWALRVDGPAMYGVTALVLPVTRTDGASAALKLQLRDEESEGEPLALSAWDGEGPYACWSTTSRPARCCSNGWTRPARWPMCRTRVRRCSSSRSCRPA